MEKIALQILLESPTEKNSRHISMGVYVHGH